jgi:hypothetical protein
MTVTNIATRAATRAGTLARHPSTSRLERDVTLPVIDRAQALTVLARNHEAIHTLLSSGTDSLDDDTASEVLQWLASSFVHRLALPSLVFTLPQLISAVRTHDAVRDGEIHPGDLGCHSHQEALQDAADDIDAHLYPLLTGLPLRDACRRCRHTRPVSRWETQVGCSEHHELRLS